MKRGDAETQRILTTNTLESVFALVKPLNPDIDVEEAISAAKAEKVERTIREL